MAPQKNRAKKVASSSGQVDRLSALPDGALQHILGFLPAHEVVRTSVLATRWRSLWKSVRRLHITCPVESWDYDYDVGKRMYLRDFVNPLFLLRDRATLEEVKFDYDNDDLQEETNIWVRHALLCQVQVLIVNAIRTDDYEWITLEGPRPFSNHLRELELYTVCLQDNFLDFSSCPVLEDLWMSRCEIRAKRILSPSLELLHIEDCYFADEASRTSISVPNLIQLHLSPSEGTAPLLESMPLLETATINQDSRFETCEKERYWISPRTLSKENFCGTCAACCGDDEYKGRSVVLGGLSDAVNLKLTAKSATCLIFRRDLIWCPTFSKLKKLSLNDWCLDIDLFPLVCILNHSPVLENLTLYLYKGLSIPTQMEGNSTTQEKPTALSWRLKIIKIICQNVNDGIYKTIKFLSTWDVEVNIKRNSNIPFYY